MSNVPQPQDDRLFSWAGRNYARFAIDNDIYCVPVDEPEEQSFDEIHGFMTGLFNRIVLPPISLQQLDEPAVLDCGYGKGQWIDAVLEHTNDEAWCIGIDIYTGEGNSDDDSDEDDGDGDGIREFEKKRWNLNASFRTSLDPDLRPETFDLINSRLLGEGINTDRWGDYVKELKILLKPGGWLQMVEIQALFQSDSGRRAPWLELWWQHYQDTMIRMGKNPRIAPTLGTLMNDAGFGRVTFSVERLPIGGWMSSRAKQELGNDARDTVIKMVRSATLWPFMQRANPRMTAAQYETLIQGAERELSQNELKLYLNVHYAYGQRPRPRKR